MMTNIGKCAIIIQMERDNLEQIQKINLVVEAKSILFDTDIKSILQSKLQPADFQEAERNSKAVHIYRFIYRSNGNKVLGFLVEPKNQRNLPCIIYNRGGSRDFGAIKIGNLFGSMARLASQGYIVIASNYSGSPGSEGVDDWGGENLEDILNLYKILKQYERADIKRIGMYGWSRGAAMTYMCLARVRWIRAAVVGAGSTDEVNAPKFRKGWREHQIGLYGKSRAEQVKRSAFYWPERFSKKTPLLIMHGSADWRVNPMDSLRLAQKLYEYKVPHRLVMFDGADHGISEYKKEVDTMMYSWFDRFVKNAAELPNLRPHGK